MREFSRFAGKGHGRLLPVVVIAVCIFALGQSAGTATTDPPAEAAEMRAAHALEVARGNPLDLRAFLVRMPKGADLHVHLTGAVYAESFIRAAAEDQLCVNLTSFALTKPVAMTESAPPQPVCGDGKVPVAQAFKDQHLYDAMINAFSMRSFVPSAGNSGHDHFFDSFAKFGGTNARHTGEWVDEVASRAAAQNEQVLELMATPTFGKITAVANSLGWSEDFGALREKALAAGLRDDVAASRAYFDQAEAVRRQREHCGEANETVACKVQVRYIYQVFRAAPRELVFAQTLLAMEIASDDPRVAAVNFVQPEDGYNSMAEYNLHMRIVGFLHSLYPKIHISLHAGELAPGLVTPDGLCCHIRLAVEQAHAERIGHGVDVMYEDRAYDLLREMAAKHVMVEINLSSNEAILGVSGKEHPFPTYRRFHVPVALSTDDEGVSRIDLTHEYVRAVATYGLTYADLKQLVRTSIEHSFLSGADLWREQDSFTSAAPACAGNVLGGEKPSSSCATFLASSEKATQQWELERRFRMFESSF